MKQIILITDGCSNVGMSPIAAAAHAQQEEIVINVIGVVDQGHIGEHGAQEIQEIARAGGGMSRIVSSSRLAQTVQMMTRKTVMHSIQQTVQTELQKIMGDQQGSTDAVQIEELPPDKRAQVVHVIDTLGEQAHLQIALLIDSSASMEPKLGAVKDAIRDLLLSLQARQGDSELSVLHFPGRKADIAIDVPWTRSGLDTSKLFHRMRTKGTTPTGPAILQTVQYFNESADKALGDYIG